MKKIMLPLLIIIFISSCSAGGDKNSINPNLTAQDAVNMVQRESNLVILDIRTPGEYKSGHIKNSININYYDSSFFQKIKQLSPQKKYLIYCRSGNRTSRALSLFKKAGIKSVWHISGGIRAWKAQGNDLCYSNVC